MSVLGHIALIAVLASLCVGFALTFVGDELGLSKAKRVGDTLTSLGVILFIGAVVLPIAAVIITGLWDWAASLI